MPALNLVESSDVEQRTLEELRSAVSLVDGMAGDTAAVAARLYAGWYACPPAPPARPEHLPPALVEMLRAAHAGARRWEAGWRVERVTRGGRVVARKGEAARIVERSDYVAVDRPGLLPRPGDEVRVTGCCDLVGPDGWWRTWSPPPAWTSTPPGVVRLYWSLGLVGLPGLVSALTDELADEEDPWLLKCAVDPDVHCRADATVAYLTAGAVRRRAASMAEIAAGLGSSAGPNAPPLTLRVAPGLAAAVDPGEGESFGEHRCRLVAEALAGRRGPALDAVVDRLAADGVTPARPWARRDDPPLPWER